MDDLQKSVEAIVGQGPAKIVLSAPRNKQDGPLRAELRPLEHGRWQMERFTATQAFHENLERSALADRLVVLLQTEFTQLHTWTKGWETALRVTKKGRVLTTRRAATQPPEPPKGGHNREKKYLLPPGQVIEPLVDMGIFTREGRVAAPMQDKYRQINRFVEQVDDVLKSWNRPDIHVIDFGCGKSYLTFILYHYLTEVRGLKAVITGLDLKKEVVAECNRAAEKYGYTGLRFLVGDIAQYTHGQPVDMVVTLHACDTATDYALASAVAWGAKLIFSVPCCQHELNGQIQSETLPLLTRYGLVKERVSALMTDAVRANLLTACGYKTQLLEFVDFAHTPKNILIRAVKTGMPVAHRRKALEEVRQATEAFALQPTLCRLLEKQLQALE